MAKIKMLAAFAVGYVAGSAAGRQRYEEIKNGAQRLAGNPTVQSAARKAQDTVAEKAPVVAEAVRNATTSAAGAVADKVSSGDSSGTSESPAPPAQAHGGPPLS